MELQKNKRLSWLGCALLLTVYTAYAQGATCTVQTFQPNAPLPTPAGWIPPASGQTQPTPPALIPVKWSGTLYIYNIANGWGGRSVNASLQFDNPDAACQSLLTPPNWGGGDFGNLYCVNAKAGPLPGWGYQGNCSCADPNTRGVYEPGCPSGSIPANDSLGGVACRTVNANLIKKPSDGICNMIAQGSTFIADDGGGFNGGDPDCNSACTVQTSQSISFGAAPTVAVAETGAVSATATSGLAVTFSSLTPGVCTVFGSTVTGVSSGGCTIAANQAGNANYLAAPQVTQNITVSLCPLGQRYFNDVQACVAVTQLPTDPTQADPLKTAGPVCPSCGKPINPGTGNMYEIETDYTDARPDGLSVSRTYNSKPFSLDTTSHTLGANWTQAYDSVLKVEQIPWSDQRIVPTCWRRADNLAVWCEYPPLSAPDATHEIVSILRSDGKKYLFKYMTGSASLTFVGDADVNDTVTKELDTSGNFTGWTYVSARGDTIEHFDAAGVLISMTNRDGARQQLTYSDGITNDSSVGRNPSSAPICSSVQSGAALPAGRLLCVTDDWGRQIQFEYDVQGRTTKMTDPANQAYLYAYDGPTGGCAATAPTSRACTANNLTQITYPDGKKKTYYYNEAAQINGGVACPNMVVIGNGFGGLLNSLTGVIDENGTRHMSWTYDCAGRATSSQLAGGVEKVSLAYGASGTTVTHYLGIPATPQTTVRNYSYQTVLGVAKNIGIDQPCVECGSIKSQTYDANGNSTSRTDWNGNQTTHTYDLARNLETSRTEASGTAKARTITTNWHPTYRLPVQISEPGRTTTFIYDANGNLLQKAVNAGSQTRTWTYTYNSVGQVLTATGPRTDIVDTNTFTYDAQGNLASITNALGHVTQVTAYDPHGKPLTIIDPNGLVIQLAYDPRQRLTSRNVGGEVTTYQYDGVGQLTQATLPDGSALSYTYDPAHRLIGIGDSLGNSIAYTLDVTGNRIQEQVKDPAGVLSRQITRVYDVLNRLQQITGGLQ